MSEVTVVGGGLAGCETAWQLAERGVPVRIYEMRPHTPTGAHRGDDLGEIVCSNSFKSTLPETASGLLKAEMEVLGCRLLEVAHATSVPAGHALGIDRELFARAVTEAVVSHPRVTVVRERVDSLDLPVPAVLATGPLTAPGLSEALRAHCSADHLYFYDAIAPSIDADTIAPGAGFWASRYGKGEADYLNIPLDEAAYGALVARILAAERVAAHAFEEERYFEACLPIEVIAARGDHTLRHGPLKPKGLADPRTGREAYAVIQLRRESRRGSLMGLVGFQTRMKWPEQKAMIRSIPGMERVEVLRYGSIHRNMFLDMPRIGQRYLRDRRRSGLYYAGQICGVEGYVESIMSGIVVALAIHAERLGRALPPLPEDTMIAALMEYVHAPSKRFQPMNANMGLLPGATGRRGGRRERHAAAAERALERMRGWREANPWLFA
jgi:methylenetetrahydrofolate--tRNA-(uracil-5-)-methyltransferase